VIISAIQKSPLAAPENASHQGCAIENAAIQLAKNSVKVQPPNVVGDTFGHGPEKFRQKIRNFATIYLATSACMDIVTRESFNITGGREMRKFLGLLLIVFVTGCGPSAEDIAKAMNDANLKAEARKAEDDLAIYNEQQAIMQHAELVKNTINGYNTDMQIILASSKLNHDYDSAIEKAKAVRKDISDNIGGILDDDSMRGCLEAVDFLIKGLERVKIVYERETKASAEKLRQ
jgi:hypothetical protein